MNCVGRYEITERLGQGGMGTVYKAFDPLLTRVVAVKVISAQLDSQPEQRERFFREARAAAQLSHRNIVTIFDLGEQDGAPFLAMEYLVGRDLEQRMREGDRMSLARKLEIALMVCEGLAHAHSAGVIHRDIKPANIFITDDGQAKILDFGLARLVTSELTRSNMMVGTVNYMSPEQLRGEKSDHRADIFSFGVVALRAAQRQEAVPGRFVRLDDVQDPERDAGGARSDRSVAAAAPDGDRRSRDREVARRPLSAHDGAGARSGHRLRRAPRLRHARVEPHHVRRRRLGRARARNRGRSIS